MFVVVVGMLAAQVSVDTTPLLTAGEAALADAVVDRLLDDGYTLWPPSPRQARLLFTLGNDAVVVALDDDAVSVARGEASLEEVDVAHAALGLLRRRRLQPGRVPRGAVDVEGAVAASSLAAARLGVPVSRRAPLRLCSGETVTLDTAAEASPCVVVPRSWIIARDDAAAALENSDLTEVDDDDGWAAAPEAAGAPGPDERVRRVVSAPVDVAARVHVAVGSVARLPALDPAIAGAVDVVLPSAWAITAVATLALRSREDVRVTGVGVGVGGVRSFDVGAGFSVSVGAALGGSADIVQGDDVGDVVGSLAVFVPASVSFDLGGGADIEASAVLRVTDGTVDSVKAGRTVWEGGPVALFVGIGGSFGGRAGDPR